MNISRAHTLSSMNRQKLEQLFANAQIIDADSLDGSYAGKAYALPLIVNLPVFLRSTLTRIINGINCIWYGKSFHKGEGNNLWRILPASMQFACYRYYSCNDGNLCLDYQQPENPKALHSLRGKLRRIDNQTLLGKVEISGKTRLFFTLTETQQRPSL